MNIVLQSVYDIKEEAHLHQLSSSTQFYTVSHVLWVVDEMSHPPTVHDLLEIVDSVEFAVKPRIHILPTAEICPKCIA